jgi:glycosyltransferase involved in cell wall biosynthesis
LKVSVVVPTKNSELEIETCLASLLKNKRVHEIIIVDDSTDRTREIVSKYPVRLINAPRKNISEARNLGVTHATGDIVAFTDDDCIIPVDWVEKACSYFADPLVGAVGGPNLTPKNSGFREKCTGMALGSWFGTGFSFYRYSAPDDKVEFREVDESRLITCNLFLRKTVLDEIGLFNPIQFPCEENELLHRMKQNGFRLIYVPSLYVWHHRRPIFLAFVKQIYWYGVGRALLVRRSTSSFKAIHAIPSVFSFGLVLGFILSMVNSYLTLLYGCTILIYFLLALIASIQIVVLEKQQITFVLPLTLTLWLTHTAYGLGFIRGLLRSTDG